MRYTTQHDKTTKQHNTTQHDTRQDNTTQHDTTRHEKAQHDTIQYNFWTERMGSPARAPRRSEITITTTVTHRCL